MWRWFWFWVRFLRLMSWIIFVFLLIIWKFWSFSDQNWPLERIVAEFSPNFKQYKRHYQNLYFNSHRFLLAIESIGFKIFEISVFFSFLGDSVGQICEKICFSCSLARQILSPLEAHERPKINLIIEETKSWKNFGWIKLLCQII